MKKENQRNALARSAKKLLKLRLTDVGGRKEHPAETVKSALKKGLGGLYDDSVIEYILKFGIKYYLQEIEKEQGEWKLDSAGNLIFIKDGKPIMFQG